MISLGTIHDEHLRTESSSVAVNTLHGAFCEGRFYSNAATVGRAPSAAAPTTAEAPGALEVKQAELLQGSEGASRIPAGETAGNQDGCSQEPLKPHGEHGERAAAPQQQQQQPNSTRAPSPTRLTDI